MNVDKSRCSKEGLYLGKQRTEKSAESTTKIKQTEKRDAKGEKGR
jgi:hypothetical protein